MATEFKAGPPVDAVPIMEPLPTNDTAPKRRGRPPGSKNANGSSGTRRGRPPASLEKQIGGTLTAFNLLFMAFPPTQADALDPIEISALAKAIDAQAKANPTFRKYLTTALEIGSGGQLFGVAAMIAARRFARHNIVLPPEADEQIGAMLAFSVTLDPNATAPDPIITFPSGSEDGDNAAQ